MGHRRRASPEPAAASREASNPAPPSAASKFRELKWEEFLPKDWDPMKTLRDRTASIGGDADPRARLLMEEVRAVWDSAPTVSGLDGAAVKLPRYVVPLEELRGELKEFLLVPYFGACIHTPPPPANQIVFVASPKGVKFRAMDTVWVTGTIRATRQASSMGSSGYRIDAVAVDRYAPL
jgi:hypothetical protein